MLAHAADGAVPVAKPCPYSKRWWTPELTALKRAARRLSNRAARRRASPEDAAAARATSHEYHTAIRRQKRLHWRTYVESATEQTIWQASKYVTQAPEDTLASRLPALKLSDGSVAQSCSEKRDTLMAQFFPAPPPASLSDIAEAEYDDQLQFMPFSGEEVEAALENLSPFKAPDLLELIDPKDRQRLSLGYIDDTAIVVTSPSIAINIRILTEIVPLLLNWSCMHACRFDIGKFQLVHHTRYEPRYEPLPLQIDGHTIIPSESAKYLGIIIDRRLRWHEHVEAAIAKGTAAVLAVGRLARPTFGLPHQYARRLFKAVVCPRLEYGLPVWYTPVCRRNGSHRATGSVGIARRIGKVQRLAGLMITGAFKSTSNVFLDYHADLLPIELRLNQAAHRAAAQLASLPDSHPLYKAIQRCTSRYPRFHRSPLHELFHCFSDLRQVATVCHTPLLSHAGELPFELVAADTKGEAQSQATKVLQGQDTCVFVKGAVPVLPCASGSSGHLSKVKARDDAAAAAGGSESSDLPRAVLTALHNLQTDRKVLLKQYDEQLHGLSRRQCSILSQLRSGHIGLNAFLAQIRAIDSPLCLTCAVPETVPHFLFTCRRFTTTRHAFRTAVEGPLTLRNTIGNAKARAAVLDFVDATGRFEAYRAPPQ
ncbi:hypothetical protein V8D89_007512 [Ganoderma adspersum]